MVQVATQPRSKELTSSVLFCQSLALQGRQGWRQGTGASPLTEANFSGTLHSSWLTNYDEVYLKDLLLSRGKRARRKAGICFLLTKWRLVARLCTSSRFPSPTRLYVGCRQPAATGRFSGSAGIIRDTGEKRRLPLGFGRIR